MVKRIDKVGLSAGAHGILTNSSSSAMAAFANGPPVGVEHPTDDVVGTARAPST
ncbi:MAG: hypothetical protein IPP62_18560 [bacterium]|nr:hypothetical protein [bacterium]